MLRGIMQLCEISLTCIFKYIAAHMRPAIQDDVLISMLTIV